MREIKFRAWDDKWDGKKVFNFVETPSSLYILMQYTGLKDKNGKEIYEGDIVKTNINNIVGYVYYSAPSFGIKQKKGLCTDYDWSDFDNFEVIGNIYENPELLDNK